MKRPSAVVIAALFLLPRFAQAQLTDAILPVDGTLVADDGTPEPGPVDITVRLFDAATAGTELFAETHPGVALDAEGRFVIYLGTVAGGLPLAAFAEAPAVYAAFDIDGAPFDERVRLGTVPYAGQSAFAAECRLAEGVAPGSIDSTAIAAGAVRTENLGDLAVSEAKLAPNAVTDTKIQDDAVTTAKILDGTVAGVDLASDVLTVGDLQTITRDGADGVLFLGSIDRRLCFLAGTRYQGMPNTVHRCTVVTEGNQWILEAEAGSGAALTCAARCLTW